MAEIEVGDRPQADHDNMFKDTVTGKVIRRVKDDAAIAVLEAIVAALGGSTSGTPHFNSVSIPSTPGTLQTLLTETIPAGFTREFSSVHVSCRQEGIGFIYADSTLIGSFRTGAASPNCIFDWSPRYVAVAGQIVKVDFTARSGSPISTVDCHFQAVDKPI